MIKRSLIVVAAILGCAIAAPAARAAWPDHPIRFIVGFGPGGANDLIARFAAEGVGKQLHQTVIVENRPGAGAVIGTAYRRAFAARRLHVSRRCGEHDHQQPAAERSAL